MGSNYKESGETIVAEKDGNGHWVLYNQERYSASNPFLKIDEETGEVTWMNPLSAGGISSAYFTVFKSGSTIYAMKYDGAIVSSSSSASTVLQYCHDNVPVTGDVNASGGIIHIMTGVYDLDTAITWNNREVTWEGEGWGTQLRSESGSGANVFELSGPSGELNTPSYGRIFNMWLDGNSQSVDLIHVSADAQISDFYMKNCLLAHAENGLYWRQDPSHHGSRWHIMIKDNTIEHTTRALDIEADLYSVLIINNEFKINTEQTLIAGYDGNNKIHGGVIAGNVNHSDEQGLYIKNTREMVIANNKVNAGENIADTYSNMILESCKNVLVVGNSGMHSDLADSNQQQAYGLYLYDDCDRIKIYSNQFYGTTSAIRQGGGTNILINGVGEETRDAGEPQSSFWPIGTTVDFTESPGGTGTGIYQKMPDGNWSQLA